MIKNIVPFKQPSEYRLEKKLEQNLKVTNYEVQLLINNGILSNKK